MTTAKQEKLQDVFLNNVKTSQEPVVIYLANGIKLQGVITWFDKFSMLLNRDNHCQLVYKHAISTVMPLAAVQLYKEEEDFIK